MPRELSYDECLDASVRNFYLTLPGAAHVAYRSGDNVKRWKNSRDLRTKISAREKHFKNISVMMK